MPASAVDTSSLLTLGDFEREARTVLDEPTWAYVAGGAGGGRTVAANAMAFGSVWLRPRVLGGVQDRPDTRVTVVGQSLSMPLLLAPTSPQRLVHEEAELASARIAAEHGLIPIISSDSHFTFGEIAKAASNCWFQLYAYGSRDTVAAMIQMGEEAGAKALVVTVDANHPARRIAAWRAGFKSPQYVDFGTLRSLGVLNGGVPANARLERLVLTWEDLEWIRARTPVPLLVKGILDGEDARRCAELGAEGIIVSNHGGRQLDGVLPSLVALQSVAAEVPAGFDVLMDGGVRSGVDVVKALALGARAVCIGRPYLWGLSIAGAAGVEMVLELLRAELEDTLRQLGVAAASAVGRECVTAISWNCEESV